MTTITSDADLPVPPGAEPDLWTAGGVRDVYSQIGHVPTSPDLLRCPAVTVIAEQHRDGTLGAIDVDVDARAGLSAAQARELARLLNEGADLADRWVGREVNVDARLALARAAVQAAHTDLRTAAACVSNDDQFGAFTDAASYLVTAQASIVDAVDAVQR